MKILLISILMAFSMGTVCADGGKTKGKAVIKIAGKTHTLSLKKCYYKTVVLKGKPRSVFIIATHKSRRSKEPGPRFNSLGSSHTENTTFHLSLEGGSRKGGVDYRNTMPFDSFKNNKLNFKGSAKSIKKMGSKVVKESVPIEITVNCL